MIRARHSFPRGFLWGTATSSHQVEGGNTLNDWWRWEQRSGAIEGGDRSGAACGWWDGNWAEDLDRAAEGGQNAHRLSIEWSRIEPSPDVWEGEALERYRQMLAGALDRGLMPMVTLHHFTTPAWLSEMGGWLNPQVVPLFERYVRKTVAALHDLVGLWITINEPNVYGYAGFVEGYFPPGMRSLRKAGLAIRNMLLAHAAAYHAIHQIQPGALVGVAHHLRGMRPANPRNPLDRWVAGFRSRLFNELFPRAAQDGRFRFPGLDSRHPQAAGTQDFLGLNYYTAESVAFDPRRPGQLFSRGFFPSDADLSPHAIIANEPDGLWQALRWVRRFDLPIYVTENGVEDEQDALRRRYLAGHVRQVWRAANANWKVRGYFHWTLVDNFEWTAGWHQRFGLWSLDPRTQERRRRPSADLYAEICRENALSADMVARHAPEILEALFPSQGPAELGLVRA